MRWITLTTFLAFAAQQLSCCAPECGHDAECGITANHGEHDPCHQEREHNHGPSDPCPDHHLCVATHLFYMTRTDSTTIAPVVSLSAWQLPDSLAGLLPCRAADHFIPLQAPDDPGRLRARLSVWVI